MNRDRAKGRRNLEFRWNCRNYEYYKDYGIADVKVTGADASKSFTERNTSNRKNCWNCRGKNFILIANIHRSRKVRSVEFEETARGMQLDVKEKLEWNCKYSRWCVKARNEFQSLRDRTVGENQKYVAVRREILRNCASIAIFKNSRVNTR